MEEESNTSGGLIHRLRRLLDTFVALIESRLELATVEAKEARARLIVVMVLVGVTLFAGSLAMILLTALAIYFCRANLVLALAGFAVVYGAAAFLGARALKREMAKPIFGETLAQIKKDREWLIPRQ